jgi:hypothetical protein
VASYGEEIRPHKNIHVCANEVSPTDRVLALGCRRDSVATQDISDRQVGQPMAKIRQRTRNAIITPGGILLRHLHHHLLATSLRNQPRMVSGLAVAATFARALRPRRCPMSAGLAFSAPTTAVGP